MKRKRQKFIDPPPTDWAKLREAVVRGMALRDQLNEATEQLNTAIRQAAIAVGTLRLGVVGRVAIREDMLLVFTHGTTPEFTIRENDDMGSTEYPLLQAPRSIRLHAVQFFPVIIKAMATECHQLGRVANKRVAEVERLLAKLKDA
jgi:hypothetical protein